ncbi:Ion channel [Pseudoxanthobacter soli DSM 19599]|uniref:Ion channel n=1 Tax=Pseudoxanthobacter soli DSM 19599 TaxID=1123029 RepID=A0A1M7ZE94_9HYPH|nr:potassium channel family protein [Pseudoxanthobacter soli]SHO63129.1 Ion channel [Pseudoxanthobacter soli DSM 19599]
MSVVRRFIQEHLYMSMTVAMIGCLLLYPSLEKLHSGVATISLIDLTLVLLAIRIAHNSRRMRWPLAAIAVVAIVLDLMRIYEVPKVTTIATLYFCLFYLFAIYSTLKYVLRAGAITLDKLFASLVVYMAMAFFWALVFDLIHELDPSAFGFSTRLAENGVVLYDFLYFSFVTLTTTGYGDIVPYSHQAQSFAVVEQMVGVLYVAILVARLTNLYTAGDGVSD